MNALRKAKNVHTRYALLLALGEFAPEDLPTTSRAPLLERLADSYGTDPSSAIHGATGWLLRRWGRDNAVAKVDHTPISFDTTGLREWFVREVSVAPANDSRDGTEVPNGPSTESQKLYFTFIVFKPGELMMGSPEEEPDRQEDEELHPAQVARTMAVTDCEITWGQLLPARTNWFDGREVHAFLEQQLGRSIGLDEPVIAIQWYEGISYCRWLTSQAGMSSSDQCYDELDLPQETSGDHRWDWPVNLNRAGFRLPTETEWEYVCRSGTDTAYSFGNDSRLLKHYGWFTANADKWSHRVAQKRPNLRGLFDLHGNVAEFCQDWYAPYGYHAGRDVDASELIERVNRGGSWYCGAMDCRSAFRYGDKADCGGDYLGFRLVITLSPGDEEATSRTDSEDH